MKHFLENLDRQAGRWLGTLDAGLHDPLVRVLSGEVFQTTPAPEGAYDPDPPEPPARPPRAQPPSNPICVPGTILYNQ